MVALKKWFYVIMVFFVVSQLYATESKPISRYQLFSNPLKATILLSIRIYQATISRVQGDVCNFYPSCSHYGYEAIERFDVIKGILKASDRVQRCHGLAWFYRDRYGVYYDSTRGLKLYDPVRP